ASDPDGGYLVPAGLDQRLHTQLQGASTLRQLANVCTISTDALEVLVDKDTADVGWVTEAQERLETATPPLIKVRIPAHEMYAKPRATQKLLDDSHIHLEEWLALKVADRMAAMENPAFILGDGMAKPKGILAYGEAEEGKAEWGKI